MISTANLCQIQALQGLLGRHAFGGSNSANNLPKAGGAGPPGLTNKGHLGPPSRPTPSPASAAASAVSSIPPPPPQLPPQPPPSSSPFGGLFGGPPHLQVM